MTQPGPATAPLRLIVVGKQGSGKGTQCERLADHFDLAHLSTGDLLRDAVRNDTRLGREVQHYLDEGELVPDSLMVDMVVEAVESVSVATKGYLLDGYPRTIAQAESLFDREGAIDAVIDLEVPTEVVLDRLARRRVCTDCAWTTTVESHTTRFAPCERCHGVAVRRADDNPTSIERRLALYAEQTGPLLDWLDGLGLVVSVDGDGSPEVVFGRIIAAVAPQLQVQAS